MNSSAETRPGHDTDTAILKEQVDLVYRQGLAAGVLSMINATVLVAALLDAVAAERLIAWYLLLGLVVAARSLLVHRYRARPPQARDPRRWRDLYAVGAAINGLCWGLAGTWLFPGASPMHQAIVLILVAGIVAGAVTFHAAVLRIHLAFSVPALLPIAVWMFFQESGAHAFVGFIILVFLASMALSMRRMHMTIMESLRLRYENADLIHDLARSKRELQEANRRLQGEIAEHTRTENELRDSYQFLQRIMDNTTNAIYVLDPQGRFVHMNHLTTDLTGYAREELMDRPFGLLFAEEAATDIRRQIERVAGRGEAVTHHEAELLRRDGERRSVCFNLAPLYDGDRINALVGTAEDITERKKIERLKSEFLSTVSHELRTPLTSIRGSLGLLHGSAHSLSSEQLRPLVEIAYKNTDRLIKLINDLLDIQKLEAGEMRFSFDVHEVDALIRHALAANAGLGEEYEVSFDLKQGLPGVRVEVDLDRFAQVLTNLLSNACKFSPPGERVEIEPSLREAGCTVRIAVTDHGPGIPPEFRDRVFHRFAQADSSTTRRKGGTGLGLSIAKGMIERMGGRIGFRSVEGAGTTFYVDLPAAGEAGPEAGA